jgi:hypothetical protein
MPDISAGLSWDEYFRQMGEKKRSESSFKHYLTNEFKRIYKKITHP